MCEHVGFLLRQSHLPETKLFWLAETILILHPGLNDSLFCINHSMYWLNRIKLMMLHFNICFNDRITQEKNTS